MPVIISREMLKQESLDFVRIYANIVLASNACLGMTDYPLMGVVRVT